VAGSKNNPNSRQLHRDHTYNGQKVKPVLYDGRHAGHGKYYAIELENNKGMITDKTGMPLSFSILKR